jgi:hypothetical protein
VSQKIDTVGKKKATIHLRASLHHLTLAVSPGFCGFLLRFGFGLGDSSLFPMIRSAHADADEVILLFVVAVVDGVAMGASIKSGKYDPYRRCEITDEALDNASGLATTANGLGLRLKKLVTHIGYASTTIYDRKAVVIESDHK